MPQSILELAVTILFNNYTVRRTRADVLELRYVMSGVGKQYRERRAGTDDAKKV